MTSKKKPKKLKMILCFYPDYDAIDIQFCFLGSRPQSSCVSERNLSRWFRRLSTERFCSVGSRYK